MSHLARIGSDVWLVTEGEGRSWTLLGTAGECGLRVPVELTEDYEGLVEEWEREVEEAREFREGAEYLWNRR